MFRTALVLVCLACAVASPAGAIPLSLFPTELTQFDSGGVLNSVDVYVSGREPYDMYFLQVAKVQGTVELADALTREFGHALAVATGAAVDSGSAQWPDLLKKLADDPGKLDDLTAIQTLARHLEQLIDPLARAAELAPGLAAQLPGLATRAPQDFSGLRGRLKLIGVMNALRKSSSQLGHAALDSKRILENVRAVVVSIPK